MGYNHKLNRNQYSLDREDYKDLKDYERHCSSVSTKIQWSGKNRFYTNCVLPNHEDRNPSLVIKKGDKRVIFSCLADCDRDELTSYFRNALGGL